MRHVGFTVGSSRPPGASCRFPAPTIVVTSDPLVWLQASRAGQRSSVDPEEWHTPRTRDSKSPSSGGAVPRFTAH